MECKTPLLGPETRLKRFFAPDLGLKVENGRVWAKNRFFAAEKAVFPIKAEKAQIRKSRIFADLAGPELGVS